MSPTTQASVAPFGTWASPVSAELAASSGKSFAALQIDNDQLYWLEARPLEGGRMVLVKAGADDNSAPQDITPADFNIRTRVHEYGGGAFLVSKGTVYFSNFADQALYAQPTQPGSRPQRISKNDGVRFADCFHDKKRNKLICVREDHRHLTDTAANGAEPKNEIVSLALDGTPSNGNVLWSNSDFVAYPRLNAAGSRMAWISWDHPNMPWDSVALWVADVNKQGELVNPQRVNADTDESVLQPTWQGNDLYVLTDRSGWWNVHKLAEGGLEPVHSIDAELGGPLWGLGAKFFAFVADKQILVEPNNAERHGLALLNTEDGSLKSLNLPYSGFASMVISGNNAYALAGRKDGPSEIIKLDVAAATHSTVISAGEMPIDTKYLSVGQHIEFPTANQQTAYAYYYPPANADFEAPEDELPPLLVLMHGGPTGATGNSFNIAKQFWTSRGIAVVDVNYRGSTGYGRDYRRLLNGQWGVVDLEDAVAVTRHLIAQKLADPHRLLIRGGSAGGYTTLAALAFTEDFAAGANYFGVSDLEALAKHTHKFESRYLDSMIGPYPEAIATYKARSPINALEGFNSPLITFQGLEDQVVPPAQSEMIYKALKEKGTPTAYITFPGEQHGFRKAQNNITALESELYFYGKVLGFEPHGDLPAVAIDNFDG